MVSISRWTVPQPLVRCCACGFRTLDGAPTTVGWRAAGPRAVAEVDAVLCALGREHAIPVYESDDADALALMEIDNRGRLKSAILYRAAFLHDLDSRLGPWASLSVLAHEVGHHVDAVASPLADVHPWTRELAADRVSGLALARLGASLPEAQAALRVASEPQGGPSHPTTALRLEAVAAGWRSARDCP